MYNVFIFSLHIPSMRKTICDALHIPVSEILVQKSENAPPPPMKIWGDLGTLSLSWSGE